jgi:hypothetical protein
MGCQQGNRSVVDGTNNGCERAIGWWIKERYRTIDHGVLVGFDLAWKRYF